jgi:hypothetical protein
VEFVPFVLIPPPVPTVTVYIPGVIVTGLDTKTAPPAPPPPVWTPAEPPPPPPPTTRIVADIRLLNINCPVVKNVRIEKMPDDEALPPPINGILNTAGLMLGTKA